VAQLTEGTTASFVKELIRRTVLIAAIKAQSPKDEDLLTAARELMSDQALLTRNLLGGTSNPEEEDFDDDSEASSFGYIAHSPMSGSYFPMALGEDETDLGFKDEYLPGPRSGSPGSGWRGNPPLRRPAEAGLGVRGSS